MTWTAPNVEGTYTVKATATADGVTIESEVDIIVLQGLAVFIDVSATEVAVGTTADLEANVSGFGADNATITWAATDGTLSSSTGTDVTWTAPNTEGTYTIVATIVSGEETLTRAVNITVEPELSVTIVPTTATTVVGEEVTAEAVLTGFGADRAQIQWEATRGHIVSNTYSPTLRWEAPRDPGSATIKVTVTSGDQTATDQTVLYANVCSEGNIRSKDDPCILNSVIQLQAMRSNRDGHYALGGDIDASVTADWSGEDRFEPIGGPGANAFRGSLDGRGFQISNLTIRRDDQDYVGLFGSTRDAEIVNLDLVDIDVSGGDYTGAVVGRANEGTIRNVSVSGIVRGGNEVGGLVGRHFQGLITNSSNSARIIGSNDVGGIAGYSWSGTITAVFNTGRVIGDEDVGGVAGVHAHDGSKISFSYNTGAVIGDLNVGGVIGNNSRTADGVNDSYNMGSVGSSGSENVGGIAGFNYGEIKNTYNTGALQGDNPGGVVGYDHYNDGIVLNSYYDSQTSNAAQDGGGTPRTTEQMQSGLTFSGWSALDWLFFKGAYPNLRVNRR